MEERSSLFICYLFRAVSAFILLLGDRSATSGALYVQLAPHIFFLIIMLSVSILFVYLRVGSTEFFAQCLLAR